MDIVEVEKKETLSRQEIATRLRRIANILATDGEQLEFERGGMKFNVAMPEQVEFKVEIELGDENELEIELNW